MPEQGSVNNVVVDATLQDRRPTHAAATIPVDITALHAEAAKPVGQDPVAVPKEAQRTDDISEFAPYAAQLRLKELPSATGPAHTAVLEQATVTPRDFVDPLQGSTPPNTDVAAVTEHDCRPTQAAVITDMDAVE